MRIKRAVNALKKRRKIMRLAKGYWGLKSRSYRIAREAVMKSQMYAFIGRRQKKRDFRKLWIARINAAARQNGLSYSKFMYGLKASGINLNRKVLSEIAISDPKTFAKFCENAKVEVDKSIKKIAENNKKHAAEEKTKKLDAKTKAKKVAQK